MSQLDNILRQGLGESYVVKKGLVKKTGNSINDFYKDFFLKDVFMESANNGYKNTINDLLDYTNRNKPRAFSEDGEKKNGPWKKILAFLKKVWNGIKMFFHKIVGFIRACLLKLRDFLTGKKGKTFSSYYRSYIITKTLAVYTGIAIDTNILDEIQDDIMNVLKSDSNNNASSDSKTGITPSEYRNNTGNKYKDVSEKWKKENPEWEDDFRASTTSKKELHKEDPLGLKDIIMKSWDWAKILGENNVKSSEFQINELVDEMYMLMEKYSCK